LAQFNNLVVTQAGILLQQKIHVSAAEMHFTRVAFGDGEIGAGQTLQELTDLVNEIESVSIDSLALKNSLATIRVSTSNAGLATGYYMREVGIFAQDPDAGEILYAIANAGETADFIPPQGGAEIIETIFDLVVIVGNAASVSAVIDDSLVYVTRLEFMDHVTETTGIHGVGASAVESAAGAQAKVDVHEAKPAPHSGHETPAGAQTKVDNHNNNTEAHSATSAATANRIIRRDANGRAKVAAPSVPDDIANKGYVDNHANATNVHGATASVTGSRIVMRDSAGRAKVAAPSVPDDIANKGYVDNHATTTNPHSATSSATASRLVLRDSAGRAKVAAPSVPDDIANKGYVDNHANATNVHGATNASNVVNSLMRRDSNGRCQIVSPAAPLDIANKAYIDTRLPEIITGTISSGQTIPLPSGYTQAECQWIVSPKKVGVMPSTSSGDSGAELDWFEIDIDSYRRVTVRGFGNNTLHENLPYCELWYTVIGMHS
jgi:hypothetical protein